MLVSVKYLEELLNKKLKLDDLKRVAINLGMEIEGVTYLNPGDVFLGRIKRVIPHPRLENLCILEIKTTKDLQIVSADKNLKVNELVLVVSSGGKFKGNVVQERDFAGIKSNGMLVSEEELGIAEKSKGVIILEKGIEGQRFNEVFDDLIVELKIPTNRPDLLSVIGIAREFGIGLGIPFFEEEILNPQTNHRNEEFVKLLDREGSPRYTARIFEDVRVKESPFHIKWRLYALGMKGINNVVDITNMNMLLYGQPLHPFDLDLIKCPLVIRKAYKNEEFITLEGTKFKLDESDLVIADREGSVALAGIIGSKRARITPSTNRVLLESAYFNPKRIAHTRRRLGIQTEASMRFERRADLSMVDEVSRITGEDFKTYAKARECEFVGEGIKARKKIIRFNRERLNTILSLNLSAEKIKGLLSKANIKVKGKNQLISEIPHYRYDLEIEEDIYEEVARIYGYQNVPATPPVRWVFNRIEDRQFTIIKFIRDYLVGLGFNETYNISFVNSRRLFEFGYNDFVRIKNPLNERFDALRPTLFFGLLDSVAFNLSKGNDSVKLFEIGNILLPKDPFQEKRIGVILGGQLYPNFWNSKSKIDYYDAKGVVEAIFEALRIKDMEFDIEERKGFSRSVKILYSGLDLGYLGIINKDLLNHKDFFYFEVSVEKLVPLISEPFYIPPGKYPANIRDLSFLFDEDIKLPRVRNLITKLGSPILEKVLLFDYYKGDTLPRGKKSFGFRLYFRAQDRTLTDEEVDRFVHKIVEEVTQKFQAQLRKKEKS